ncbi:hypothetical protein OMCYN_00450 [cyanobiont of Ornithocercus magnificus]|nr:hypothetical protein OMCYN_00450 [cyanobiont of Ornithocercus magnificus]
MSMLIGFYAGKMLYLLVYQCAINLDLLLLVFLRGGHFAANYYSIYSSTFLPH